MFQATFYFRNNQEALDWNGTTRDIADIYSKLQLGEVPGISDFAEGKLPLRYLFNITRTIVEKLKSATFPLVEIPQIMAKLNPVISSAVITTYQNNRDVFEYNCTSDLYRVVIAASVWVCLPLSLQTEDMLHALKKCSKTSPNYDALFAEFEQIVPRVKNKNVDSDRAPYKLLRKTDFIKVMNACYNLGYFGMSNPNGDKIPVKNKDKFFQSLEVIFDDKLENPAKVIGKAKQTDVYLNTFDELRDRATKDYEA